MANYQLTTDMATVNINTVYAERHCALDKKYSVIDVCLFPSQFQTWLYYFFILTYFRAADKQSNVLRGGRLNQEPNL